MGSKTSTHSGGTALGKQQLQQQQQQKKNGKGKNGALATQSSPVPKRRARSDSLTGQALVQREMSSVNEALVRLHLGDSIRKVYTGLGPPKEYRKKAMPKPEDSEDSGWLGAGNWGTVRVVTRIDDQRKFACKILRLSKNMSEHRRQELLDEILVLSKLDHPHIAKLYETYEDEGLNLYLVMELLAGGELFKRLTVESRRSRFSERVARHTTRQMTSAIAYLHSRGIVHRDLKLENFVYREQGGQDLVLIDFGLSVKYKPTEQDHGQMHDVVGSSYYIAPEVLRKNYGLECDIWSLGVIVYMLLSGTPPFKGETEQQIMSAALAGVYSMSRPVWMTISEEAKDFVRRCLVKDVTKRMTAKEALDHPWLAMQDPPDLACSESSSTSFRSEGLDHDLVMHLRDYTRNSRFKRIALQAVAYCLSHEEIKELEDAFKAVDRDSDGHITYEELRDELVRHEKLSAQECKEIFDAIDFDKTGKIHFNEFIAAALTERYFHDETVIQHAFERLDMDQDGLIDVDEMHTMFGQKKIEGHEYASDVLQEVIAINEERGLKGKLTMADFLKIMREGHEATLAKMPSARAGLTVTSDDDNDDDFLSEDENGMSQRASDTESAYAPVPQLSGFSETSARTGPASEDMSPRSQGSPGAASALLPKEEAPRVPPLESLPAEELPPAPPVKPAE